MERKMTIKTVAEMLGVSLETVRQMILNGSPIGMAIKHKERTHYIIYPEIVRQMIGGKENEE